MFDLLMCECSAAQLCPTLWTVARKAPLSMEFCRQEYWNKLPFPTPVDLPDPEIEPVSLHLLRVRRWILYHWATWEALDLLKLNPNYSCKYYSCILGFWITAQAVNFFLLIELSGAMPSSMVATIQWSDVKVAQLCLTLCDPMNYSPWNSPGQSTGVGILSLFQGIFPTQGSNPGLLHCKWILYQLSHKGSPRILEWVAYAFSSRSSRPRNRTGVSCIAGRFFTSWAMREGPRAGL